MWKALIYILLIMANTHFFTFELDSLQYDNANDNLVYQGSGAPAGFWSKVKADGGDIRVFHDSSDTAVACEVVHIDTGANELELHFDATDGTAGQSEVWRIEYGDGTLTQPAVGDALGRNNVWTGPTGSYEGVWHLQEDPSGTAPQMIDSTGNGNNGTTQGTMVSGDSVAGKLAGNALRFETSKNQYVKCGTAFSAPTSFAQSAWIHPEGTGFLGIGGQWDGNDGFLMRMENDPGDDMRNWVDGANNGGSNTAFTRSAWNHAAHVWDGTTQYSYQAGSETDTDAVSSITAETGVDFNIGSYADGNVPFEGPIDEYRVMWNVALSANWISTEYNNTNDDASFWPTVSAEQSIGGGAVEMGFSMGVSSGISHAGSSVAEAGFTLSQSAGISSGGDGIGESNMSLSQILGISAAGDASISQSISLAQVLGTGLSGDASISQSISLGSVHGVTITSDTQTIVEMSFTAGIQHATAMDSDATINVNYSLGTTLQTAIQGAATAEAAMQINTLAAISMAGSALTEAGISMDAVSGISISGSVVTLNVTLADGRTLTIKLENRTLSIDSENRTYTISREDRTYEV